MVDARSLGLRLLELVALLFPVVALLLQLQQRVADSEALERLGLAAGGGLLFMLSLSFFSLSVFLFGKLPSLLLFPVVLVAVTGLLIAAAILPASETAVDGIDRFLDRRGGVLARASSWFSALEKRGSNDEKGKE